MRRERNWELLGSMGCMILVAVWVVIVGGFPRASKAESPARPPDDSTVNSTTGAPAVPNSVASAVCPFESQSFCQTAAGVGLVNSDRLLGRSQLDDFRPATDVIERICWSGCFTGSDMSVGACDGNVGGIRPPHAWQATFYEDNGGLPSSVPLHATYDLVVDAEEPVSPSSPCWNVSAPLEVNGVPEPLTVVPGDCYWMKLDGLGEVQSQVSCIVSVQISNDGNNMRLEDNNGVFEPLDQKRDDISFCLSSGILGEPTPPVIETSCLVRPVACCLPDGSCEDRDYTGCVGTPTTFNNAWAIVGQTCASATCPAIPANDDCANATVVCQAEFVPCIFCEPCGDLPIGQQGQCQGDPFANPPIPGEICDPSANGGQGDCFDGGPCTPWRSKDVAYRCSVEASNILASKDTPIANPCPGAAMNSDVWYQFAAPCSGLMTIRTCRDSNYDGMMAAYVFNDGCDGGECPIADNINPLDCNDDFCPGTPATAGISGEVDRGSCVKVAVGGWAQNNDDASAARGLTVLDIGFLCVHGDCGVPPMRPGVVDGVDHDIQKQRFLSITPVVGCGASRMRVSLLDHRCSVTGKQCLDNDSCTMCDAGSSNAFAPCDKDFQCGGGLCVVSGETCEFQSPPLLLGWVGDPVAAGGDAPPGTLIASVVTVDPGFRVWSEPLVHITDCEIAPGRVYRVAVENCDTPGLFASLDMRTTPKPVGKDWGDIVGNFDGVSWSAPNGLVGVDDVLAMIKFLTLKPAPHITVVDLVGPAPTFVNTDVTATDLLILLRAFMGELYPPFVLVDGGYPDLQNGESLTDCPPN